MLHEALLSAFHYMGGLVLFAALAGQFMLLTPKVERERLRILLLLNAQAGAALLVVLVTGVFQFVRWGASMAYYLRNELFLTKMALCLAILGLYLVILRVLWRAWRQGERLVSLPPRLSLAARVVLLCLLMVPLLSAFVARGMGISAY
ncbi:MAG: DUF2214 family protein [Gammaproteobacteria bacterium]|nr:DUF2214 family protein [Gammaproteobacteria bacterium]